MPSWPPFTRALSLSLLVRFDGTLLSRFFALNAGKWRTHDGAVELCERDVIQVRTTRVSSGEGGIAIALDVAPMADEMELIKTDGSVYAVDASGAVWTRFVKQAGVPPPLVVPGVGPRMVVGDGARVLPTVDDADRTMPTVDDANRTMSLTLIIQALYNVRLTVEVTRSDSVRSVRARVARECQVPPEMLTIVDMVLVRTGESIAFHHTFGAAGVEPDDAILVISE